jgi:hypothetical protein
LASWPRQQVTVSGRPGGQAAGQCAGAWAAAGSEPAASARRLQPARLAGPVRPAPLGLDRHAGDVAARADGLQRLHPQHVRRLGQAGGQRVLVLRVPRDEAQQEIAPAADHVALPHLRPCAHHALEGGSTASFWVSSPTRAKKVICHPRTCGSRSAW